MSIWQKLSSRFRWHSEEETPRSRPRIPWHDLRRPRARQGLQGTAALRHLRASSFGKDASAVEEDEWGARRGRRGRVPSPRPSPGGRGAGAVIGRLVVRPPSAPAPMRLLPALLVALLCAWGPPWLPPRLPLPPSGHHLPAAPRPRLRRRPAKPHEGWAVLVRGDRIDAVGPAGDARRRRAREVIDLPGTTLLPGPDRGALAPAAAPVQRDAVGRSGAARSRWRCASPGDESRPRHAARRLHDHARPRHRGRRLRRRRPQAGRSTRASSPGRACSSTTRAIVATGSYGPEGLRPRDGTCRRAPRRPTASTRLVRVVRDQIGHGADWIKVYARLPLGPQRRGAARPSRSRR